LGLRRGLNGVLRCANFRRKGFWAAVTGGSDYQTAAAAGALCIVVRRKTWIPRQGDDISGVFLWTPIYMLSEERNTVSEFCDVESEPISLAAIPSLQTGRVKKNLKVYTPP